MPEADPANKLQTGAAQVFRDMIAFVVAHELAHFLNHHLRTKLVTMWQNGSDPIITSFISRELEIEADICGIETMVMTWSYDPRGALLSLSFMDYLDKYTNRYPTLTDSHPMTSERFAIVTNWLICKGLPYQLWWR
jgi:predicted Zn-dependent protease